MAAAWGEEAADTLFELVAPSGQELATKADLAALEQRLDARFDAIEGRFGAVDGRFEAMEGRFEAMEGRFEAMEERADARAEALEHRLTAAFERRIADAVTAQTRTLVFSQLGALVAIASLAFGLR